MTDNTIFDDVFRTMLEKMPHLVIPVINEVFGTDYPEDCPIEQRRNEHETKDGKIVMDSHLFIENKIYHIECQSTGDSMMVIRMVEYDFATALENAEKRNGKYRIYFPHSCVIYLRGKSGAQYLEMELVMPNGDTVDYRVPIFRAEEYTKDIIFQKKLLFLLPYYVIRYEKQTKDFEKNPVKLNQLLSEYNLIIKRLNDIFLSQGKEKEYRDLIELISRIANYIFRDSAKTKKGIGDIMGGKVLELESDRLVKQGELQGELKGAAKAARETALRMLKAGKYPLDEISLISGLELEQIEKLKTEENL